MSSAGSKPSLTATRANDSPDGDTDFTRRVAVIHRELGIDPGYMASCKLPLYPEPQELVATEPDYYGRPQRLTGEAFAGWQAMKQQAAADGVTLHLISAFRDLYYQRELIARKLAAGQSLAHILRVNAAPGYSEHHTGRAIDIGTTGCDALVEEFENTQAFQWLEGNAGGHGFYMSFPRDNPFGIDYEPWHWCFKIIPDGLNNQMTKE